MKFQKNSKLLATGIATALTISLATVFFGAPDQDTAAEVERQFAPSAMTFSFGDEGPAIATAAATGGAVASVEKATSRDSLYREADGTLTLHDDRTTDNTSAVRVSPGGDLFPQGRALAPAEKSTAFLERHGAVFGIADAANELRIISIKEDQYGHSRVTYQQMHGDVPVFGAVLHGHVSQDGRLTTVNGKFIPDVNVAAAPYITEDYATQNAIARVTRDLPRSLRNAPLDIASTAVVVYRENLTKGTAGANHLAYQVEVTHGNSVREFVYIDAVNGKIVDQITGIHSLKNRRVYEAEYDSSSPELPAPAWKEGDMRPAADPPHEDEIAGAGETYNLFFNLSGGAYRSWDGNDAQMITVNNDPTIVCPNANWNGTSTNYCTGTSADDVVTHEWTHAYTQETSGLIYAWQSGALNESYSDIFGETVDLLNNRDFVDGQLQPNGNDGQRSSVPNSCSNWDSNFPEDDNSYRWLLGEDAYVFSALPPVGDGAIRDLWHPSCFGDPDFVSDEANYHCTASDAGGVHANSSINNRAYALLVDGDTVTNSTDTVTVTGIGLTKAAHIFWRANSVYNTPSSNFADNAVALEMACEDLRIGDGTAQAPQPYNLTKLVTDDENGNSPHGMFGENDDTIDPTPEPSGKFITTDDCAQLRAALAAVEMSFDVTEMCDFRPMFDPDPAPMCGNDQPLIFFAENWEAGMPADWTTGESGVTKGNMMDTLVWRVEGDAGWMENGELKFVPANRDGTPHTGNVMYQENRRDLGNCADDDESGRLWLETPSITVHPLDRSYLTVEHYVNTEFGYDGGNALISVDGGPFEPVPGSAFIHNGYVGALNPEIGTSPNTNPKAGEEAWHGGNRGETVGDWGQTQIDLQKAGADPGTQVRLRFELGQDGCNGADGWYIDDVQAFSCGGKVIEPKRECETFDGNIFVPNDNLITFGAPSNTRATVSSNKSYITDVVDVNVLNLQGRHGHMGDLIFDLVGPGGTPPARDSLGTITGPGVNYVTLFDADACGSRVWGGKVSFDDDSTDAIHCDGMNSGNTFRPQDPLTTFNDTNGAGDWTLWVTDTFPDPPFVGAPGFSGGIDGWKLEFCSGPLIDPDNEGPTANPDFATTDQGVEVEVDAVANDTDPDDDELTIVGVTMPSNGLAFITEDNKILYQPEGDYCNSDSGMDDTFGYTIDDGNEHQASSTVSITVNCVDPGDVSDKVKGNIKIDTIDLDDGDSDSDSDRIKAHFDPRRSKGELKGHLHLKDKDADVKIHMKDIDSLGPVQGACGEIDNMDPGTFIIEFTGTGTFERGDTKIENASFRACAVDADLLDPDKDFETTEKGGKNDRFYLECVSCGMDSYNTQDRVLGGDDTIDDGDVRVTKPSD